MNGHARALCADEAFDPAWWDVDSPDRAVAVQICGQCPISDACRAEAVTEKRTGLYGGQMFHGGVLGGPRLGYEDPPVSVRSWEAFRARQEQLGMRRTA